MLLIVVGGRREKPKQEETRTFDLVVHNLCIAHQESFDSLNTVSKVSIATKGENLPSATIATRNGGALPRSRLMYWWQGSFSMVIFTLSRIRYPPVVGSLNIYMSLRWCSDPGSSRWTILGIR